MNLSWAAQSSALTLNFYFLYRVTVAGGVVRRRPVTMGLQNSRDAEIREGLTKGDTVVLLLGQPVSEGMLGEVAPDGDAAGKGEAAGSAGQ